MWNGFKTENELINAELKEFWPETMSKSKYPEGILTTTDKIELGPRTSISTLETDPSGKPLNTPGAKADAGKIKPYLMISGFAKALELVAEVTTKGAEKYTPNGWAEVPDGVNRYMEGFARHLLKLGAGEVYDNGPHGIGTKHKAQMIWNLLASLELEERNGDKNKTE